MFDKFDYFNRGYIFGVKTDKYKPYINYSWSQTLTVGGSQQIKDSGTAGLNLQQFFGQGCWFNGIDMQVTIPVNETIQTEINRVNGVVKINTNTQNLTNYNVYSGSGANVYKDLYMFNRALTTTEIEKYNNQPNQFFMDSLEDSSCILAMPMCEKNNLVRNYKNNTDYPITNYLTTCRTNAQRLPYGLQTSGFKRDSLGRILSKSNFLEADGVGYGDTGWIPDISKPTTIECILDKKGINDLQMNGADYLRIGVASNNTLYFRCGDKQPLVTGTAVDSAYYVVAALDGSIVTLYVNGIRNQTTSYVATPDITSFKLFTSQWNKPSKSPIRLFKIHTKALTQEEVTKNFNKYQSQGLLNE